ncbi:MAG: outer membrane beta-barrel domain-containing protein [Deltaproteobacteria bacterium]|nr:outer membrane beta-barrel domain-containing protein [Deltaproteobacteria bacterium]
MRSLLCIVAISMAAPAVGDERTPLDKELDKVWGKERDVKVIEKRLFEKDGRHEFGLLAGMAPNDSFWNYFPVGLRYDYYFMEQLALEFSGAYVITQATKLKSFVLDNFKGVQNAGIPQSVEWYAGLNAVWTPFHGKLAVFTSKLTSFDLGVLVGIGAMGTRLHDFNGDVDARKVSVMGNVGLGFRFFLNDMLALRADYRHYLYPADDSAINDQASSGARQMAEITLGFSVFTKAPQ